MPDPRSPKPAGPRVLTLRGDAPSQDDAASSLARLAQAVVGFVDRTTAAPRDPAAEQPAVSSLQAMAAGARTPLAVKRTDEDRDADAAVDAPPEQPGKVQAFPGPRKKPATRPE